MDREMEYVITVIEDEATPLAGSVMGNQTYFPLMVFFVFFMIAVLCLMFYLVNCIKYRERYIYLCGGEGDRMGWNIFRLRRMVRETENEKVSKILDNVSLADT